MSARISFKPTIKSLIGVVFLACGALVMAVQLWSVASRFDSLVTGPAADCLGALTAFGLASLRVLQSLAFDRSMLLSLASSFLLSFTALGIALAGLALLRKRTPRHGTR